MSLDKNFREFRDFSISFNNHPVTRDMVLVRGKNSITQSIINILSTKRGERLVDKDFGTDLTDYLFDSVTESTAIGLRQEIERAIRENEGRVRDLEVIVNINNKSNGYDIIVLYLDEEILINNSEEPERSVINFFLASR